LNDIEAALNKRHDNGGDFRATDDGRLAVGSPFSTLKSLQVLHELGVPADYEAVRGALDLILDSWRENGRYRLPLSGTHYPCTTASGMVLRFLFHVPSSIATNRLVLA
jgi:hypothetical protein